MPFTIVRQDITKMEVDAIVNAANIGLLGGGGVCGAIFKAAGALKLKSACKKLAPIRYGDAAITPGFKLPARFIIHAAGPIYNEQYKAQCEMLLRSAYTRSLTLAVQSGCESIAFPLISSGVYGYPKPEALRIATQTIAKFLEQHDLNVYLVIYDKSSYDVGRELLGDIKSYIDEHYIEVHHVAEETARLMDVRDIEDMPPIRYPTSPSPDKLSAPQPSMPPDADYSSSANFRYSLKEAVKSLDEPFSDTLLHFIDSKGKSDVEIYKRANIDRKLFSKIRSVKGYTPKKSTILALAVALELNLTETNTLLNRAGYALSHASLLDVIVEYFIINGKYNIFEINEVLFKYDQQLLGAIK